MDQLSKVACITLHFSEVDGVFHRPRRALFETQSRISKLKECALLISSPYFNIRD
jgi:hypothetical protein